MTPSVSNGTSYEIVDLPLVGFHAMSVVTDFKCLENPEELQEAITRLCAAIELKGRLVGEREFSDGMSATRVILMRHEESPQDVHPARLIFKIGAGLQLKDEVKRYLTIRPHMRASSTFSELVEAEKTLILLPEDDTSWAIVYRYAADQLASSESLSLVSLSRDFLLGKAEASQIDRVIASTFTALGSLYGSPKETFLDFKNYYLDRWAPDFQVRIERHLYPTGSSECLLTLERNREELFLTEEVPKQSFSGLSRGGENTELSAGGDIAIRGLSFAGLRDTALRLQPHPGTPPTLAVDLCDLQKAEFQSLKKLQDSKFAVWAPAQQSRYGYYRQRLQTAFPCLDLDAPSFRLGQLRLRNPLSNLSEVFKHSTAPDTAWLAPAHGDLHPGNVIAVHDVPLIIDYGLAEQELPIGIDSARLVGGLIRDAVSEVMTFDDLCTVLPQVLGLVKNTPLSDGITLRAEQMLSKALTLAENMSNSATEQLPYHLYGYAWIGLKWEGSASAHQACFLLAALAATKVLGAPDEDGPELNKPVLISSADNETVLFVQDTVQVVPVNETQIQQSALLQLRGKTWQRGRGFSPSLLLRPENQVVPFHSTREELRDSIIDWAENDKRYSVAMRLYTGPGGVGKTR